MALVSLNKNSARVLANSVLPTPVEPRKKNDPIVTRVSRVPSELEALTTKKLKANTPAEKLIDLGIPVPGDQSQKVGVLRFDAKLGPDYRLGHHNFFVITRYNRSQNYAMSVFELAEQISAASGG